MKTKLYFENNYYLFMPHTEFDPIVDDCFLEAGAKVVARKYENKINIRAAQIISEIMRGKDSTIKAL